MCVAKFDRNIHNLLLSLMHHTFILNNYFIFLQVENPSDTSNFDLFPRDLHDPEDEESGWDKDF